MCIDAEPEVENRLRLIEPVMMATLAHKHCDNLMRARRNAAVHSFAVTAATIGNMDLPALNRLQRRERRYGLALAARLGEAGSSGKGPTTEEDAATKREKLLLHRRASLAIGRRRRQAGCCRGCVRPDGHEGVCVNGRLCPLFYDADVCYADAVPRWRTWAGAALSLFSCDGAARLRD